MRQRWLSHPFITFMRQLISVDLSLLPLSMRNEYLTILMCKVHPQASGFWLTKSNLFIGYFWHVLNLIIIPDTTRSGCQRSLWSGAPYSVSCTWFSSFESVWRVSWKTCSETQGTTVPTRDNTVKCVYSKNIELIALMLLVRVLTSKCCQKCGINHRPGSRLYLELLETYSIARESFCQREFTENLQFLTKHWL